MALSSTTVIFKIGGLGDLLMSTAPLRAYKKSFPHEKVIFVVGESNKQTVLNNPAIDRVIIVNDAVIFRGKPFEKVRESWKLVSALRKAKAGKIIVLHRDWRWNFIAYLAGIPMRFGFTRDLKGLFLSRSVRYGKEDHEIKKFLSVFALVEGFCPDGYNLDLFPLPSDTEAVDRLLPISNSSGQWIAISPGGAANAKQEMDLKRWPMEYYEHLLSKLFAETNYRVVFIGGKSDKAFTDRLAKDNARTLNLAGATNLAQTYLILRRCAALITHDSGPMHIGAAADIPVISVFGPTSPNEYAVISNSKGTYLWGGANLPCRPCFKDGWFPDCPINKECMYSTTPESVFQALIIALSRTSV